MALWYAPSFPARCTSPGAHGAPAQPHVGMARGRGRGSARTQRVVLPAVTPIRQRSVICHRVQVWHRTSSCMRNLENVLHHTNSTQCLLDTFQRLSLFSLVYPVSFVLSLAGCLSSEWSPWSECSATCGGGLSMRNKTVLREPEPGGPACVRPLEQHTVCNTNSCLHGNGRIYSFILELEM